MLKFREFSNFLENSHFRVQAPGNSLLGTIFSLWHNLENRNYDEDAPRKYFLSLPGKCVSANVETHLSCMDTYLGGNFAASIPGKCVTTLAKTHLSGMDAVWAGTFSVSIPNKCVST